MKNYYAILEISENADSQEIKRAYRRLAKKYHPDAVRDDAVKMQKMYEIQEAYGIQNRSERIILRYTAGLPCLHQSLSNGSFSSLFPSSFPIHSPEKPTK